MARSPSTRARPRSYTRAPEAESSRAWTRENVEYANRGLTNLFVTSIVLDRGASGVVYASTNGGGVFKSSDGGSSWRAANDGLASDRPLPGRRSRSRLGTLYAQTIGRHFQDDGRRGALGRSTGVPPAGLRCPWPSTWYLRDALMRVPRAALSRAPDAGSSWKPVNTGLTRLRDGAGRDTASPSTLYGDGWRRFKSIDGAA